MKRILIYTYKHGNYGAVLQAYALQKYLCSFYSADVQIVDFTTDYQLNEDKIIKRTGSISERIIISLFNLLHIKEITRRNKNFALFSDNYLRLTKRFTNVDELFAGKLLADIYITGSDQVFNPNPKYLSIYYLGFDKGEGIKVAYAPSFGISKFSSDFSDRIRGFLKDFDYLSCRETLGASFISSIVNKEVPTVCDPTLLINSDEWSLIAKKPRYNQKYILVYELNGGDDIISLANKLSKEKQLPIVCITRKSYKHYNVKRIVRDAGPSEFLGWIKDATYVITDSFHGTVFSWVFNKEFFYYLAYEATSSRAINLLKAFGCENRIVKKESISSFSSTSYRTYEKKEISLVETSKQYIKCFMSHEE